ncbi:unnamed protein product [Pylaiella littoralis]
MERACVNARCFEAMVQALMEPAKEVQDSQTSVDERHHAQQQWELLKFEDGVHQQHMSLSDADPSGFYTSSAFFAKTPARSLRASCVRCGDLEAATRCFSCSRFQGTGRGKYCKDCFEACHPFYRVRHKWVRLEDVDQQNYRASLERNIADIQGLLHSASNWGIELYTQDADTTGGDAIKEVARLDEALSIKIRDLKDLTCEDEDRTKVSAIAARSMEAFARKFQKRYEESEIADAEAGGIGGKAQ